MVQFKYGAFQTEFDPTEVSFLERYEGEIKRYEEKMRAVPKTGKASEQMRAMCTVFFETFDGLFGEGTSRRMFEGKMSVECCVDAFKSLIASVKDYSSAIQKINSITENAGSVGKGKRAKK